jgi:hypothetical protein
MASVAPVREDESVPVHRVILQSVIEFLFDLLAHLNPIIGCDSNVSPIKKSVYVLTQEDAVRGRMRAPGSSVGPDVRCVQDMQDVRGRKRTLAKI